MERYYEGLEKWANDYIAAQPRISVEEAREAFQSTHGQTPEAFVAAWKRDKHEYDAHVDVLHLDVAGYTGDYGTREGHRIEYDDSGRVIAMTLVNVKRLLERDGGLRIRLPDAHIRPTALSAVLFAA